MTDHLALVGRGTTGYREVFAPGSPVLGEDGADVIMAGFTGVTPTLKWRIWIPPGTRSLQATLYTYASPPESKVLMRMHQPPVGGLADVTPENAAAVDLGNVLALLLLTGAEVPCYTPASAGAVKLSDGRADSPVVATTGAWLYINALQLPGQQIFMLDARVTADRAQYLAWYAGAVWDAEGNPMPTVAPPATVDEQWVLGRVKEVGLIEPLRALCKASDDAALIQAVTRSGLWGALLRFTK